MEDNNVAQVIEELKNIGVKTGIEIFMVGSFTSAEIPTLRLGEKVDTDEKIVETNEEAFLEIRNFMKLAEKLEAKAVFYTLDLFEHNQTNSYYLNLYLIHNGINFTINILSSNYSKLVDEMGERDLKEIEDKLNRVRDVVDIIFNKDQFNPYQFVTDSFLPYLDGKGIDYLSEFFKVDDFINGWFAEISGIEDIYNLIEELVNYFADEEEDKSEVCGLKLLGQLDTLVPYMYKENMVNERAVIGSRIKDLSFAIYKRTREAAMMKVGSEYVKKITNSYLEYRKELGIRNPKCTKEEIDQYLRMVSYDFRVPKELLKNAIYDLANPIEYE